MIVLFLACMAIYMANGTSIGSGDTVPNTLLGFNLLEHQKIDFDNFRGSTYQPANCYWFKNIPSGHLVSLYPIGSAVVSFPICVVFWAHLKAINTQVDITSSAFEPYRQSFEHLAASTIASFSVALFYLVSRLKFTRMTSLITTCVFAFATNEWVTCSSGLWQHGSSNLMLLGTFYGLLRANHETMNSKQKALLLAAGLCCGLLLVIRPTNLIFFLVAVCYCLVRFRAASLYFLVGLSSAVPCLVYNLMNFGNLIGGYGGNQFNGVFSFANFQTSCLGTLFSPGRGLLVYSPVLVFSSVGIWQLLRKLKSLTDDEQIILLLTGASLLYISFFFFYGMWWGGHCYGPRFMTEALPVLVFLTNYFVSNIFENRSLINTLAAAIFSLLLAFSLAVQVVGAFGLGGNEWNPIPLNVDEFQWRLWSTHDSPIERHARSLFHTLFPDSPQPGNQPTALIGKVLSATDESGHTLASPLIVHSGESKVLRVAVQNLGTTKWTGYESGVTSARVCLEATVVDQTTHDAEPAGILYVASSPGHGQESAAIGKVTFPSKCGDYLLVAPLTWTNKLGTKIPNSPFVMKVQVVPPPLPEGQ